MAPPRRSSTTAPGDARIVPGFGAADPRLRTRTTGVTRGTPGTFDEIGRSGLRHWGGFVFEEWLRELQPGRRAAEVFREMVDSDPVIGGIIYAVDILCRRASWWFEPGGDSNADEQAKEFAEQCFFEDMSYSWEDTISEALSFIQHGWSFQESVYKRRGGDVRDPKQKSKFDDGRIGIRKLAIRSQDSLYRWGFDDEGGVQSLIQNPPPDYAMREIPLEKGLLFRAKQAKQNPEGRSVLRSAYRAWYFKKNIENLQGIGIERDLAGLPVLTPPQSVNIWNANDPSMVAIRTEAEKLVSSIRRDEQEGVLKPYGWELELLSTQGRRQFDIPAVLDYYDKRIASSILADVILLGQQQVGSYALADSKEGIFFSSLDTYLDVVCAVFNNHQVPRLFKLNSFPGITDYPKLCHGPIARMDLKTLAEFFQAMSASGAPIWPNQELLEKVFTEAGLPAPDPDDGLPISGAPTAEDTGGEPEQGTRETKPLPQSAPATGDGGDPAV